MVRTYIHALRFHLNDLTSFVYVNRDLYHRVLNFTNMHSTFDLQEEGQEYFTIIQYNPDDEYT